MEHAISVLSKKYPPGEGLKKGQDEAKEALKRVEMKAENKGHFEHEPFKFEGLGSRKQQLRKLIVQMAGVAKRAQDDFDELVFRTCLKKAVRLTTNLKLQPDRPNEKAVLRIQEKLLFKKKSYNRPEVDPAKPMEDILQEEQETYDKVLEEMLEKEEQIVFTISDMVRGKCMFLQIRDIIDTVIEIQQFCQRNPNNYRIIECESRFGLEIPISDVTLKIVIN